MIRRADPAIIALTLPALAVASYRLGTKSLGLDEVTSAGYARLGARPLEQVLGGGDPNMGLYYVLLNGWVRVFGYGEASLRSLTVVLGGLTAAMVVLLGTRLFGRPAGLLAGVLLALNPYFVRYEQTARSYVLVVLLVVVSSYFFVRELEQASPQNRVGYVLASALAIYAHYFGAFVLLVQLFTLVAVKRRAALSRQWMMAGAAIVVLCLPEVVAAARAGVSSITWIPPPSLRAVAMLPSQVAGGGVMAAALLILACYAVIRGAADRCGWRTAFVAAWLLVPVLLDLAISELGRPMFLPYYLIVVLPALLILAAAGVARLPGRLTKALAILLLAGLASRGLKNWYSQPGAENYRGAVRYILAHEQVGDAIAYYPSYSAKPFVYYERLWGKRGPARIDDALQGDQRRPPRIWVVIRRSDVSLARQQQIEAPLLPLYESVPMHTGFQNVVLTVYRRRPHSAAGS